MKQINDYWQIIGFVLAYALGSIWWAATINTRVDQVQAFVDQVHWQVNNLAYNADH